MTNRAQAVRLIPRTYWPNGPECLPQATLMRPGEA
jgi:hypothetical protein